MSIKINNKTIEVTREGATVWRVRQKDGETLEHDITGLEQDQALVLAHMFARWAVNAMFAKKKREERNAEISLCRDCAHYNTCPEGKNFPYNPTCGIFQ